VRDILPPPYLGLIQNKPRYSGILTWKVFSSLPMGRLLRKIFMKNSSPVDAFLRGALLAQRTISSVYTFDSYFIKEPKTIFLPMQIPLAVYPIEDKLPSPKIE